MNRRIIPALALIATIISGAAHAAEKVPAANTAKTVANGVRQEEQEPADGRYAREFAEYRKDLAAYQADPTVWTAEIPTPPARAAHHLVAGPGAASMAR